MEPRLLVVDDEPVLAATLAEYFQAQGFHVSVAHALEEALALLAEDSFDLVVTDLRLTPTQHEEGLDLLAFLRICVPRPLAIVLTAYLTREAERTALELGASLVLQKPQHLAQLELHLRGLLETEAC